MRNFFRKIWKWLIGLFGFGVVGIVIAMGGPAEPFASEIGDVFQKIEAYQEQTFQSEGKYTQFLLNGTAYDGKIETNWNKSVKPTDTNKDWSVINDLPTKTYLNYEVHTYGKGYTIYAWYRDVDGLHRYFRSFGDNKYPGENKWETIPEYEYPRYQ